MSDEKKSGVDSSEAEAKRVAAMTTPEVFPSQPGMVWDDKATYGDRVETAKADRG